MLYNCIRGVRKINLKEIRARYGNDKKPMRQEDFARLLGITQAYLSKLEAGGRIGSIKTLKKFSKILNISIDELIK